MQPEAIPVDMRSLKLLRQLQSRDDVLPFVKRLVQLPSGCWMVPGVSKTISYYARDNEGVSISGPKRIYKYLRGDYPPKGYYLRRKCLLGACCNPFHFEVVKTSTPSTEAYQRRTHCKRGHAYAEHAFLTSNRPNGVARGCKECRTFNRLRRNEQFKKIKDSPQDLETFLKSRLALRPFCRNGHPRTPETAIVIAKGSQRGTVVCLICFNERLEGIRTRDRERKRKEKREEKLAVIREIKGLVSSQ